MSAAVDRLRALGAPTAPGEPWPDYPATYGLTRDDLPALIALAEDESVYSEDDPAVWASLHAWRALGQLGAPEGAAPLARLLVRFAGPDGDDDWGIAEVPQAMGMLGHAAFAPARALLDDPAQDPLVRAGAADALAHLAGAHPDERPSCVAALTAVLARPDTEPDVGAFVVGALVQLQATEAAPAIEAAFADGRVEPSYNGDWEDVQLALGLIAERRTPRPRYVHPALHPVRALDDAWTERGTGSEPEVGSAARRARERAKAKTKRKAAARSRRANRRKR